MESTGFETAAEGAAVRVIGATDSVEDIDNDEMLDISVDELELESEAELCDRSVVIPIKVPVFVPVETSRSLTCSRIHKPSTMAKSTIHTSASMQRQLAMKLNKDQRIKIVNSSKRQGCRETF